MPDTTDQDISSFEYIVLYNSLDFFIKLAYICRFPVESDYNYRLMAIHHSSIVCDLTFGLLEDAKRVFLEKFSYRAWLPDAQPRWSRFEDNLDDVLSALPEGTFDDAKPIRELQDGFRNMNRFNSGRDIIEVFQPESQLTH